MLWSYSRNKATFQFGGLSWNNDPCEPDHYLDLKWENLSLVTL